MKLSNKEMSVGMQIFWSKIIWGVIAISFAVVGCFASTYANTIHLILLLCTAVIAFIFYKGKLQEDDEMSAENFIKAKAKSNDTMRRLYTIFAILFAVICFPLKKADISIYRYVPYFFFVLLGIQDILTGAFFLHMEAE